MTANVFYVAYIANDGDARSKTNSSKYFQAFLCFRRWSGVILLYLTLADRDSTDISTAACECSGFAACETDDIVFYYKYVFVWSFRSRFRYFSQALSFSLFLLSFSSRKEARLYRKYLLLIFYNCLRSQCRKAKNRRCGYCAEKRKTVSSVSWLYTRLTI